MMVAVGGFIDDTGPVLAEGLVAQLHEAEYRNLVRLARLLLDDVGTSEEVVRDDALTGATSGHLLRSGRDTDTVHARQSG